MKQSNHPGAVAPADYAAMNMVSPLNEADRVKVFS
jgi:hypothetical protein